MSERTGGRERKRERERERETAMEVFKKETGSGRRERWTDKARCTHAKSYRERESARDRERCRGRGGQRRGEDRVAIGVGDGVDGA